MSYALTPEGDFVEAESSLTDRYQTTVPEIVRRFLKLGKRDKIHYRIKSTGEVVMERAPADEEDDPAFEPFLAFLARDIERHPETLRSFTPEFVQRVQALVAHVDIDLDAALSPDDE
ncbi:MAG: type II toxin-antitoxin system PrlF family antitoxin [Trinickia sp.]|uniref:type II toxin-antitoxin system PrlF family antitoxin n=1 Tax=Trinickia sp. TaxID=2571163 RepID=UPI003F8079A8